MSITSLSPLSSSVVNVFSKNSMIHLSELPEQKPTLRRARSYSILTTISGDKSPVYTLEEDQCKLTGAAKSLSIQSFVTGQTVSIQRSTASSAASVISEDSAQETVAPMESETRTSIMVRHIPCRYTQAKLVQEVEETGISFDFLYLPPAKHSRGNLGYAFINFETNEGALEFLEIFSGHKFKAQPNSLKRAETLFCTIQGLQQNMNFYNGSKQSRFRPYIKANETSDITV
jgi:hypothetical protein